MGFADRCSSHTNYDFVFQVYGSSAVGKIIYKAGCGALGRIRTGVCELIASILILIPRITLLGAIIGLGLMAGAFFFHLTKLGVIFDGDAGLFTYAVITFVCCLVLIIIYRKNIPQLLKFKF